MTRTERLEALRSAVNEWADREIDRINYEIDFLRSVKDGLSQSGQLAQAVSSQVSQLVEDEINAYLV